MLRSLVGLGDVYKRQAPQRQLKTFVDPKGPPSFVAPSGPSQCVPSGREVAAKEGEVVASSRPILAATVGDVVARTGQSFAAAVGDVALPGQDFNAIVGHIVAPPGKDVAAPKRPAQSGPKYADKNETMQFSGVPDFLEGRDVTHREDSARKPARKRSSVQARLLAMAGTAPPPGESTTSSRPV